MESPAGFEPAHNCFADSCVTASPRTLKIVVDSKGIEPFLSECKTNVLPLSLTAHLVVAIIKWIIALRVKFFIKSIFITCRIMAFTIATNIVGTIYIAAAIAVTKALAVTPAFVRCKLHCPLSSTQLSLRLTLVACDE